MTILWNFVLFFWDSIRKLTNLNWRPQAVLPDSRFCKISTSVNWRTTEDNLACWVCFGSLSRCAIQMVGLIARSSLLVKNLTAFKFVKVAKSGNAGLKLRWSIHPSLNSWHWILTRSISPCARKERGWRREPSLLNRKCFEIQQPRKSRWLPLFISILSDVYCGHLTG